MVKMQAVQSAMAVRRQRSRWDEKKQERIRRESRDSLSSARDSLVSIDGRVYFDQKKENQTMFGQVTMFHVGLVFIFIGLMLVLTGLVPGYADNKEHRKSDILGTGSVFVFIGCILSTVSRFISNNEERELNEYIQSRLSRSRSGHRLVRDAESGLPTPSRERRLKPCENGLSTTTLVSEAVGPSTASATADGIKNLPGHKGITGIPPLIPHKSPSHTVNNTKSKDAHADGPLGAAASEDNMLSKILEEDEIECEVEDETRTEADLSTEPLDATDSDV